MITGVQCVLIFIGFIAAVCVFDQLSENKRSVPGALVCAGLSVVFLAGVVALEVWVK